ncbi:MAG: hypothetical protein VB877_17295, partial [Pirellulaceae bacterium]
MRINRRKMIQGMVGGVGAAVGTSLLGNITRAAGTSISTSGPRRIIFFMQNQGFDPKTCIPKGMNSSGSLAKVKLPEPVSALEPYKERLHIINGLHGTHTSPSHSAFFGALGGYRGS